MIGRSYHEEFHPPRVPGIDDISGEMKSLWLVFWPSTYSSIFSQNVFFVFFSSRSRQEGYEIQIATNFPYNTLKMKTSFDYEKFRNTIGVVYVRQIKIRPPKKNIFETDTKFR